MKKSLIAMALMFGAVVFVASCGPDDKKETTTYSCTCTATSVAPASGLDEAGMAAYKTQCESATISGLAKQTGKATCQ